MAKSSTKQLIIDKAVSIFNLKGYDAVSLHELAGELGISRGNLTYHFKDKDILLKAIADQMWEALRNERSKSRHIPSFKNLHNEVQIYYNIQKRYGFIFLDTKLLKHQEVKGQFREMTESSIQDNLAAIALSISIGNMKPEMVRGTYYNLAFLAWMVPFFWYTQQIIRGEKSIQDGERIIWTMIMPHFTEKGMKNFTDFFGEEYVESLGEPFELNVESFISF